MSASDVFTGERFVPGIENEQLQAEHMQRYQSLDELVKNKRVLDAACGEGYGSAYMAQYAQSVVGIDLDEAAVKRAARHYGNRNNLSYKVCDISDLSFIDDNSMDVVVSFETIEHVPQGIQAKFLSEIKRVLAKDGILMMSTPNKKLYSDEPGYHNEFHIKEFYEDEFVSFIKDKFANIKLYEQYNEAVSVIDSRESEETRIKYIKEYAKYTGKGMFMLVMASDAQLPMVNLNSIYMKPTPEYSVMHNRIISLQNEVEERNAHLKKLDEEIEVLREENRRITEYEQRIEMLLETERAYEHEKGTHAYKFAKKLQKVGDFILPVNSRRRFFVGIVSKIFRHPILMLHIINPKRIKHFFKYLKLEGMSGVVRRYKEAEELEKYHLNPEKFADLNIEQIQQKESSRIEDYEKLTLPKTTSPTVSIVIPVYNEFYYTYRCVKSIIENSGDVSYEVLIANDCSTDITDQIEEVVYNIRLITMEHNGGFLLNCNNAAKYAKGKYIMFLNNDTQVQRNWLSPLVELIERDSSIGMVGSKLVYPDGFLQEAGGIVWKDASAWNYGRRNNIDDPEYNYVKEADYISGAAIMIKAELWREIGGFDERFVPAYYEDTDLAFEVRKHGYKVMYQPLSVVVHFEGVSNGTDISTGLKQYQQVNFEKFYEKWKDILEAEHENNGENVFTAKDRSGHKKHILVVDHYVPHHDQDAGGKCTFMYLKLFVKMGFKVTFIGDNFFRHEPYTTELNQMGIEVLYGNYYYKNWKEWLKQNSHYFDYVYLQRPHIAIKYIDIVKKYSNAKIFYFAHDLHHIREYREYELTGDKQKLKASKKWKKIEYKLFEMTDVGHVVGSYEQEIMQKAFPNKPIRNIPLYMYEELLEDINKDFATRNGLLYVGGFGHPPNIDAVLWFAKEVYPSILKKYPNMVWHIVGGKVPLEIQNLASDNIVLEGFVSDDKLDELYRKCRLAVVPLRYGAGVKGKVVEAGYYQIPLVTTNIGAEGISIKEGSMLIEDDAAKMADVICSLYEDYDRLRQMSDNGKYFIKNNFMVSEAERIIRLDADV